MRKSQFTDPRIASIPDEGEPVARRARPCGISAAKHDAAMLAR
jgi:hypothetical protein